MATGKPSNKPGTGKVVKKTAPVGGAYSMKTELKRMAIKGTQVAGPKPKKQNSRAVESKDNMVAARKQSILKNLRGLNAKAVAKKASNAEGNKNGYASKQAPVTRPKQMGKKK